MLFPIQNNLKIQNESIICTQYSYRILSIRSGRPDKIDTTIRWRKFAQPEYFKVLIVVELIKYPYSQTKCKE
jgi:hypothetical protein